MVSGGEAPLEATVGGDVELRSSNAAWLSGTISSVYSPPSSWKLRSVVVPRLPVTTYSLAGVNAGAEVEGVRVVQAHLGERPGARLQEWMVAVIVEGEVGTGRDAAGQVLQPLEQVGFGLDVWCVRDEFLGFGDRVGEGTREGTRDGISEHA